MIDDEINAADATGHKRTEPGALVATLQACVLQDNGDGSMFTLLGYVSIVNCGESPTTVQYSRSLCSSSPLAIPLPRRLIPWN